MRLRRVGQAFALLGAGFLLCGQAVQERVEVSLVRVDLIATDSESIPIRDLKASEIHLRVDGHDCPIVAIDSVGAQTVTAPPMPSGRALEQVAAPIPTPLPAAAAPGTSAEAAPSASYAMAVFVDETSSEQFNRTAVYKEIDDFLQKGLPEGYRIMLERFDGKLHIECPWSADVEKLRAVLATMKNHAYMPLIGQPGRISPAGGAGGTVSSPGLVYMAVSQALANSASGLIEAIRTYPADIARRKTLVVVTDGAPFLTAGQLVQEIIASSESTLDRMPPQANGEKIVQDEIKHDTALLIESSSRPPRWFSQMSDATQLAMRREIEIIPARSAMFDADAGGITADMARRGTRGGDTAAAGGALIHRTAEGPGAAKTWAAAGMSQMASVTGGEAILSRARIGDQLRSEVDRGPSGYVLTFRDPYAGDNRFHQIEVRVDRTRTTLRYRHGYRILLSQESLAERAVVGLYEEPKDNPLGARIETRVLHKTPAVVEFGVVVSYPLPSGTATDTPRKVLLVGVCANSAGQRSEPFWVIAKGRIQSNADGMLFLAPIKIRIDPTTTALSFAVRDETTGLTSFFVLQPDL